MRLLGLHVLACCAVGLVATPARADDNKKDQEKLQGKWTVVSGERDGQAHEDIKNDKLTIAGDKITVTKASGNEEPAVTFALDAAKKPKHLDLMVGGMSLQAIYELEGDTLKLCFSGPNTERPTDFTTKAGSNRMLATLKRDK